MKKILCDHCGKEINDEGDYVDYVDYKIEFEANDYKCDLCSDCLYKITNEIEKRLKEFIGGHT